MEKHHLNERGRTTLKYLLEGKTNKTKINKFFLR